MTEIINIIGVPGTGKSTHSYELANSGDYKNSKVLHLDILRECIKYLTKNGEKIYFLNKIEENILSLPSTKHQPKDALYLAHLNNVIKKNTINAIIKNEPETTYIVDGFFTPDNNEKVIVIKRDYEWLKKANLERIEKKEGKNDIALAEKYASNQINNQMLFLELIKDGAYKILEFIDESKDSKMNIPTISLKENYEKKGVDIGNLTEEILNNWKLAVNSKNTLNFKEGINHALTRY